MQTIIDFNLEKLSIFTTKYIYGKIEKTLKAIILVLGLLETKMMTIANKKEQDKKNFIH